MEGSLLPGEPLTNDLGLGGELEVGSCGGVAGPEEDGTEEDRLPKTQRTTPHHPDALDLDSPAVTKKYFLITLSMRTRRTQDKSHTALLPSSLHKIQTLPRSRS